MKDFRGNVYDFLYGFLYRYKFREVYDGKNGENSKKGTAGHL